MQLYGVPPKPTGARYVAVFYYTGRVTYTHAAAISATGATPGKGRARAVYVLVDSEGDKLKLRMIRSCRQSDHIRKVIGHKYKRL